MPPLPVVGDDRFEIPDSPGGGGPGYGSGPGGSPFIPTFGFPGGGGAQGFQGLQGFQGYSPFDPRRRPTISMPGGGGTGRQAFPTSSLFPWVPQPGKPGGPGGPGGSPLPPPGTPGWNGPTGPGPAGPGGGSPQYNSVIDIINALITHGVNGDMPGFGGAYSLDPPASIMGGLRSQAINDAGAQQRGARLGLQARGDADPSTYGFQSLMSDLQGQRNVAGQMGAADLALRQQQLQNYWNILNAQLGSHTSLRGTELGRPQEPSPWGQFLGGVGGLAGGMIGSGSTKPWWA